MDNTSNKARDLFPAATRYFDRMDGMDKTLVIDVFDPDAVVLDNGISYSGRNEILAWLNGPASAFTTTSTWLSASQADEVAVAILRLDGNFPGSPVDLRYEFVQAATGMIQALAISVVRPAFGTAD
ncbi:nuclear transport factor 2 family protein [Cryobacterium zhongshanensis]|uniref:Nuclear transport factor 2 family protein n=1 Tax=Cryobacterium zhongshanensis TaxID=2928153 RepID=A0AA41QZ29_9MICO|nr:nuclear transport factor 2 family protein [Cryobacterium zhongshanensis]MCI4659494.1 nuclear transport factor 2 family protein [Cryobacterium zhongshanensis]